VIRISQDGLHGVMTSRQNIHFLSLIYQQILERASVLVEDSRSINPEVINDLASCGAYDLCRGRRSLRGSLDL
jgi:hypothetical protein